MDPAAEQAEQVEEDMDRAVGRPTPSLLTAIQHRESLESLLLPFERT